MYGVFIGLTGKFFGDLTINGRSIPAGYTLSNANYLAIELHDTYLGNLHDITVVDLDTNTDITVYHAREH